MKLVRKAGVTSEIWQVWIADSSSTTGAGLTGLAFNTASLTAYYHRDTDTTATAITLVTMTVGTFTSSGFKEIDATNMPGWYQFCPPNAALASGAKSCAFHLKGATNMAPLAIEVQLVSVDVDSATAFMTSVASVVGAVGSVTGNIGGNVVGSVGSVTGAVGSVTGNVGGNVTGSVGSVVGAVGSVTGNVGGNVVGSVASVTGAVGSVTGNVGGNVTGSIGSLAAQAKADVNAEVDSALDTAIPGTPTANSINERVKTMDDAYTATRGALLDHLDADVSSRSTYAGGAVASVTGNVGGNVVGSVGSVAAGGLTAASGAVGWLDAAGLNSDAVTEIVNGVLAAPVEGSTTLVQSLRLHNSVLGGKASGLDTSTNTFRDLADSKDVVVATTDANGNRTAVTRTLT